MAPHSASLAEWGGSPTKFAQTLMTDTFTDAFAIAGLEPKFSLSPQELDERQKALNRALHPDRHASGSAADRRAALTRAVDINQAIRTLRNPIERADALLRRYAGSDAASPGSAPAAATDPELLMEMMEGRQQLQGARARADRSAIEKLSHSLRAREQVLCAELGRLLDPPSAPTRAELQQASRAVDEMRYLVRFRSEVEAAQDDLDG